MGEWIKKFFGGIFEEMKQFVMGEIKKLSLDAAVVLKDPAGLYKQLKVEDHVMGWLSAVDRTPKDLGDLDFIPAVPSWIEEKVVQYVCRTVFVKVVAKLRDELEELSQKQVQEQQ